MAPRITAMDWDSYKNRDLIDPTQSRRPDGKALETEEDRLQASFDINRGARDQEEYVGNEPRGAMPDRISIIALVKNNPLTIPHINSRMDDATAARAAQQHYSGILEAGGQRALQLLRAAATEGNKAVQKARELGNGDDFTVVASHQGAAQVTAALVNTALDLYPASREDAVKRGNQFYAHEEESVTKTIARARKEGWGNRDGIQQLPTNPAKVDFAAFSDTFNSRVRPQDTQRLHPVAVAKLLDRSHLVRDTNENSDTFGRVVGLTESLQKRVRAPYHETIVDHANSPARGGSIAVPPSAILSTKPPTTRSVDAQGNATQVADTGVALSTESVRVARAIFADPKGRDLAAKAIEKAGKDEEIVLGSMVADLSKVKTKARISTVHNDKTSTFALEQHGYTAAQARYLQNGKQMIDHATQVDMYLGDTPNPLNTYLLGYAAERGNIGTIVQGDRTLSLSQAQSLGASSYLTPAQMMRQGLTKGLDVEASDPATAVFLTLLRSPEGRMANRDIHALQGTGMELRDIIDAAQDPDKSRELTHEHRVSLQAVRMLKTGDVSFAAGNLPHVLQEIQGKGLALVGRSDFPAALRNDDPNGPTFAIISGDVESFRNAQGLVGVVGDRLRSDTKTHAEAAAAVAPHLAALAQTKQPRAWVDGQTPFPMDARKGDIVVIPGGVGVFNNSEEEQAHMERDMAGAITVSFDTVPSYNVYRAPKGRSKTAKGTQEMVRNLPNDTHAAQAGTALGQIADRLIVTNGDTRHYTAAKTATAAQLRDGKRVLAVPAPSGHPNALTNALLRGEGTKSLRDANFGTATVEEDAMKAVEGGPVAIRLNPHNPEAAAKAVVGLVKTGKVAKAAEQAPTKTQEDVR